MNEITLDEIALETGLSIGFINRIERGYVAEIKNPSKRKRLENYIQQLEKKTKESFRL
ncbi:hypothetical protein ACFL5P_02390 [candidate division KSB1 bacterium]